MSNESPLLRVIDRFAAGESMQDAAAAEGVELDQVLARVREDHETAKQVRKRKRSDPPPDNAPWAPHVLVDISAIGALTALALTGVVPGLAALSAIGAVHALYAAQVRKARAPRSPLLALVAASSAAATAMQATRALGSAAVVAKDVFRSWIG